MVEIKRILIVDGDKDFRNALAEQFVNTQSFLVEQAGCYEEAIKQSSLNNLQAIVLDMCLPDIVGLDLCKIMRNNNVKVPIIMLFASNSGLDIISALDAGGNDYVTKPFKFSVLLARIWSQLKQFEETEDERFALGPYSLIPLQKYLLKKDGQKIRLTEKETKILKFLLQADSATVRRDVLLHEVWGYNADVTTHTLETHIYRLRRKIEQNPANAKLLVTEAGGYRIVTE